MATITDSGAVTASTSNVSTYASASFAPAVGDLLVVLVVASTTVDAGDVTVSANGVTSMTRVDRSTSSTSIHSQYIFVANQLTTGTASMTVTFDCTGDDATGAIVMVARVAGMTKTGATAIKQSVKLDNGAGGTTPTFVLPSSCLTGNPTLVVLGQVATAGSLPPSGWTEAVDTSYGTPTIGGTYVFRDSGFTGTTITWGDTETAHGGVAVELDASGSGTTPVSATRSTTWDVLASVSAARSTTWDTRAEVAATRSTTFDVLASVTAAQSATWDTLASVAATRATTWDVRAVVAAARAASWDVLAAVSAARAASWDVLASVSASRVASWDTRAEVSATRSTTWNVLSSLIAVSTTRAASWNVKAQVSVARVATWDTRAAVETSRATTWRVLEAIATARAASWRTLAVATVSRVATWRTMATVSAERATTWDVASDVVVVTPPERTIYTSAESRTIYLPTEESRTLYLPAESRTIYVPADTRTIGA